MNSSIKNKRRKKLSVKLSVMSIIIALSLILITSGSFFPSTKGQTENCHNLESKNALPVLLIHGWNEGSGGDFLIHFDEWEQLLNQERIPFCIISFEQSLDACGSSADHAKELAQIVQNIINETGQNQVNIVGYSKGGLDARVYLASNLTNDDVANLIMIGTPNAGAWPATITNECWPAILDIRPGAPATKARENTNTEYYTIAGTCKERFGFPTTGDGLVFIWQVHSQPSYFNYLGPSPNCHENLLGDVEYGLAEDVLKRKK